MNTTTNKQDETLVYAAKSFAEKLHNDNAGNYKLHDKDCFIAGAKWQKEQDKVIIDKLIEALEKTNNEYNYSLKLLAECGGIAYSENNFSISNKQLLNSLK